MRLRQQLRFRARKLWKCAAYRYQFSVTAQTIFQDRKRPIRDCVLPIAIFLNGANGNSAPTRPRIDRLIVLVPFPVRLPNRSGVMPGNSGPAFVSERT